MSLKEKYSEECTRSSDDLSDVIPQYLQQRVRLVQIS
jgi:hypothetical protein